MFNWTNRSFLFLVAAMLGGGGSHLLGQKSSAGGAAGGAATGAGTAPTVTRGNPTAPTNTPTLTPNNTNNPNNDPYAYRPIFLSGKVMFDDGSQMNMDVRIERVCGTTVRTEGHADSKGRFSFQVGNNASAEISSADSSQSDFGTNTQNRTSPFGGNGGIGGSSRGMNPEMTLWGCELRASYPGYRSDVVTLAGHRSMDDPNVGTIILHRLGNVQGTTISLTTAEAPKSARKNFEKGLQAARKGNPEEAEKRFLEATSEYPKFAEAWFTLGRVQQGENKTEDARKSYLAALEADKRYVSPYDQLALLAARENKWDEAAQYSKQAIELNPVEFPSSFWYNTVSNYNLNRDAEATKSGQALLKLDTQHRFPEVNRLLAEVALNSKDYATAANYLKAYLAQVPNAKDAETLKQQLLKIEEASVQVKK